MDDEFRDWQAGRVAALRHDLPLRTATLLAIIDGPEWGDR